MQFRIAGRLALSFALALLGNAICAAEAVAPLDAAAADPHAAHRQMMATPKVSVNRLAYEVPNVELIDESGHPTNLKNLLSGDQPVAVNFIFTTCTTICPVMTATMLQLQKQLEDDPVRPNYVSISIDPDYDSATVMKGYAARYGANWTFLTGSSTNVMTALQSFDAYHGNKVNHFALTLMRGPNDDEWTRVEGLTSAQELARIWRETVH
jgi:protein SCO1/2